MGRDKWNVPTPPEQKRDDESSGHGGFKDTDFSESVDDRNIIKDTLRPPPPPDDEGKKK